jgi:hypothetical protein
LSPSDETVAFQHRRERSGSARQRRRDPHSAKWVGDLAEETVYEYLKKQPGIDLARWLERERIRPGWAIEYIDSTGKLTRVEVQGTALARMASCDLTSNEWDAAVRHGESYHLMLVTGVGRNKLPKLTRIIDPAAPVRANQSAIQPTAHRLALNLG